MATGITSGLIVEVYNAEQIYTGQADLAELLRDAVDNGASVNFVAPLEMRLAESFWAKIAADVAQGLRVVLVATIDNRIVGTAQLSLCMLPNGEHRADVQKMLVHSAYRRRGIANQLLQAIDRAAQNSGRTLLVLDTERSSAGEALYERYGYIRAGIIPDYALNSTGDHLIDSVFFYRRLPDSVYHK